MVKAPTVRLVDVEGKQLGIVNIDEALKQAADAGYDLVEIAPSAQPPVCKIMDFGKYKYEIAKKTKEYRKKKILELITIMKIMNANVDFSAAFFTFMLTLSLSS